MRRMINREREREKERDREKRKRESKRDGYRETDNWKEKAWSQ